MEHLRDQCSSTIHDKTKSYPRSPETLLYYFYIIVYMHASGPVNLHNCIAAHAFWFFAVAVCCARTSRVTIYLHAAPPTGTHYCKWSTMMYVAYHSTSMKEGSCRIGRSLTTVATGMSIEFSLVYSAGIVAMEEEGVCVCVNQCIMRWTLPLTLRGELEEMGRRNIK